MTFAHLSISHSLRAANSLGVLATPQQQSGLVLHRTRHLLIRQQTAVINAIRAHLAEFGIVAPVGRKDLPVEPAAKFDLAGEKNTLNPLGSLVFHPPLGESVERRNEGAAVLGEAVLGRENRSLVKFAPRNNAVGLEIAQVL
jgi:transposase